MPLAKNHDKKYTYRDYLAWPEDLRSEIINGIIFDMTPAPSRQHQAISRNMFLQLHNFFRDRSCEVYYAPFDVRLPRGNEKDSDIDTVVQPDISVICDKKKLDDAGCRGAPDFIIEIQSPSTAAKDLREKLDLYEKHGVKEYWVVSPEQEIVMAFTFSSRKEYGKPAVFMKGETIESSAFQGLQVDLGEVFIDL